MTKNLPVTILVTFIIGGFPQIFFNVLLPCVIHIHVEHHIKWSHARARQGRNVKLGLIVQGGWALKLFGGGGM